MGTTHKAILGDARDMSPLRDESVELVVTSPPYWQLKDYGSDDQIGFHQDYSAYINDLNLVWTECNRVLKPGCRMCINIGDQFARSVIYGRYKVISIQSEIIRCCETLGLDYMGTIIWRKVTTTNTTGGATIMGSFPYPRNGIVKIDYEHILLFKKPGKPPKPTAEQKDGSALNTDEWNQYFSGHWNFPGERSHRHLAPFPIELPKRVIRMFTFTGEIVLDPFAGSGTTMIAAAEWGRNSIGIEIGPDCADCIKERFGECTSFFESQNTLVAKKWPAPQIDQSKLAYIFEDPHALDKKIDPRNLRFGSVIANGDIRRRRDYVVRDAARQIR